MRRFASVPLVLSLAAVVGCASTSTSGTSGASTPAASTGTTTATSARLATTDIAAMAANRPAGSTLVVVVRHAEKGAAPANDPPLSSAGSARAQALGSLLQNVPVSAVIVSPTRRTAETAAVVAQARNLTPEPVALTGGVSTHVEAVASAVRRHAGGVVLVVGHSNTVPAIVNALAGTRIADLCDSQYSQLFVIAMPASGAPRLVRDTYGTADGAESGCPAMR